MKGIMFGLFNKFSLFVSLSVQVAVLPRKKHVLPA